MLSKKEQIALKIKKLELINNETCQFYSENGFKCAVFSLEHAIELLKDEVRLFMDDLSNSNHLAALENDIDTAINSAQTVLNQLKGGNNV